MKSLILAALGLGLVTLPALAQDNTPAPAPDAPAAAAPGDQATPPPPPPAPGAAAPGDEAAPPPPPPPPGGMPGPKGPGMGGPRGHDGPPPPPPPKGASFKLESGDNKIDVKCADDEPMQACADIVFRMLDRFSPAPVPGGAPAAPAPSATQP